jgi:tRNA dimethylallyltransferase
MGPAALAILGPTASGKTALALELARHRPIEVISLDSALVYRCMDVGTAKPTADELAAVPHHLINIRNPDQTYSAAEFAADAQALVSGIRQRGHLPVLVGGTMMYFTALTQGLDDLPPANEAVRRDIEQQAQLAGWSTLHARLAQVDPLCAARLAPNDSQRIQRALEVFELTGRPLSSFHKRTGEMQFPVSVVSLEPNNRALLHERIAHRFSTMLAGGLLDELLQLRRDFPLHAGLPSMRCVGYRQAWDVLEGLMPTADLLDRGIFATRQLAKRQLTWLRGIKNKDIVDPFGPDAAGRALGLCLRACDEMSG